MTPDTDDLGPERRFPLREVIVLAVLLSLALLFLLAAGRRGTNCSEAGRCATNLWQIYNLAVSYSDRTGSRFFPLAPGPSPRAHDSLNLMIAFDPTAVHPATFNCRLGEATQAAPGNNGSFTLTQGTLDYAWISKPTLTTFNVLPLASDKYIDGFRDAAGAHSGHRGDMQVLMTDGRVEVVPASDLPPDTQLPAGLTR
jgi:hypothetical protein